MILGQYNTNIFVDADDKASPVIILWIEIPNKKYLYI